MVSKKTTRTEFEDFTIPVKIKLSALWAAVMFCYLYGDYFSFYVPGAIGSFISGKTLLNTPVKLFAASILMTVPALMVFLSLTLKPAANRLLNMIFGIIYTGIMLLIAVTSLDTWYIFYVFLAIVECITTSTIFWYAWKWPRADQNLI